MSGRRINVMRHYKYLVIGGGVCGDAAVEGIRQVDAKGSIGMINAENEPPYDRPRLTKSVWKDKNLEKIRRTAFQSQVELHLGRRIIQLELWQRLARDAQGDTYQFDTLLLATGGRPKRLPFGGDGIIYYRTLADYQRLRELSEKGGKIAILGSGFIGSELAASLCASGVEVVMLFRGPGIGSHIFPRELSEFLNHYYLERGVEVLAHEQVRSVERKGDHLVLHTKRHGALPVSGIVAGLGIEPRVELAQSIGLRVDSGIVVDEFLRTSHPDIYAAGDVAAFYNQALNQRLQVEHEDNANTMGKLAGRNMAGYPHRYTHLPYFYSDLFDLGYEAVGDTDPRLSVVVDWKEKFREGVIYYRRDGLVRGVLLWNVWGQVDAARHLISEGKPHAEEDLVQDHLLMAA